MATRAWWIASLLATAGASTACGGGEGASRAGKSRGPTPLPVAEILALDDDTKFAVALSDLVFAREAAVGYDRLTPAEQVVFCVDGLEREVNNGGFVQFFDNSAGDHALATIDALHALGAPTMAALVTEAVSVFPGGRPDPDRDGRARQVVALDEGARARLDQLDGRFYEYPENLAALERQYVHAHQDEFKQP